MPSTFHRAKLRRIERKAVTDAGSINLVPGRVSMTPDGRAVPQ